MIKSRYLTGLLGLSLSLTVLLAACGPGGALRLSRHSFKP